jgi:hypothetical protein
MAFNYSPKVVTDGLVLYIDAANGYSYPGSGITWSDISRGRTDGTLYNSPTYSTNGGGSIRFGGTNYSLFGTGSNFDITQNLTVESVCYPTSFLNQGNLVSKRTNLGYRVRFQSNGTFWMNSNNNIITSPLSYTINQWYHTTSVFSSNGLLMYINGELVTSNGTPFTPSYSTISFLFIGSNTTSSERFVGDIASVRLYNRALSATEVLQNYNATKTRFGLT